MKRRADYSLDRVRIEYGKAGRREGVRLALPLPPSANKMFVDVPGMGRTPSRAYERWKRDAALAVSGRPCRFLAGPIAIRITIEDKGSFDLDDRTKPILDFLVARNFIADDTREHVRALSLDWGAVEGCEIAIDPLDAARRGEA